MKNVHVKISGRVQGVFFRVSTKEKAEQLRIKGWVRNTKDGCVEAVFEGEDHLVDQMIEWCFRGPPQSKVENVEVNEQNPTDSFVNFSIKY